MLNTLRKFSKAVLALVFGLSPAAVVGVLTLFRVHLDEATVTAVLTFASPLLATLGVAAGPANKTAAPATGDPADHQAPAEIINSWFD